MQHWRGRGGKIKSSSYPSLHSELGAILTHMRLYFKTNKNKTKRISEIALGTTYGEWRKFIFFSQNLWAIVLERGETQCRM